MGQGAGEAGQPRNLALTFHLGNKSAGSDQRLWRNKLPGPGLVEKWPPLWPMHMAATIITPVQLEQMWQLKATARHC